MVENGKERAKGRTWKLVLSYDGSDFHGWQVQPDRTTVQGELRAAIARVTGEEVLPQGSGRTDAGVHAWGQVVSFALAAPIPEINLLRALNRTLPAAIRVRSARIAPDGFHARHSALAKTYEYRIFRGEICPPWLARYVYAFDRPLDCEAMQRAAGMVAGEHDFTSFAATDPDLEERLHKLREEEGFASGRGFSHGENGAEPMGLPPLQDDFSGRSGVSPQPVQPRGNVRILYGSEWLVRAPGPGETEAGAFGGIDGEGSGIGGGLLIYRVQGNGFLHHMVRNLVGTFLEIGRGNLRAECLPAILRARSRAQAGPTAPARGLLLRRVEYPET